MAIPQPPNTQAASVLPQAPAKPPAQTPATVPLSPPVNKSAPLLPSKPSGTPNLIPVKPRNYLPLIIVLSLLGIVSIMLSTVYVFIPKNKIEITDQLPGKSLQFTSLVLQTPGFLVISRISPLYGVDLLLSTPYLPAENYGGFTFPLVIEEELKSGEQLYATLYRDVDNDEEYNRDVDREMKDMFGRSARVYFKIL